jgi:hypothetical protein
MTDPASPLETDRPHHRTGVGSTLGWTTAVVFARPASWPLALAAFLLRGGIVLFVLPFVVLPTPTGLGTFLAPILWRLSIGQPDPTAVILIVSLGLALLGWIVIGGLVAAACEVTLLRWGASDLATWDARAESRTATVDAAARPGTFIRVLVVRLIAFVPFALVLLWSIPLIVGATYTELRVPSDVTVPLIERVAPTVALPLAAMAIGWILGEILGAVAARSVALGGRGITGAIGATARFTVRHPLQGLFAWLPGAVCLVVLTVPALATASIAWGGVMRSVPEASSAISAAVAVVLLAATWSAALLLAAVASTWRSVWWTEAWLRRRSVTVRANERQVARPGQARATS